MIKDLQSEKTNNKEIIEVLFIDSENNSGLWIPIMATKIYLVDKDGSLYNVKEARVRYLGE